MANARKTIDFKYEDKTQTIEEVLKTTELPFVARISKFGEQIQCSGVLLNKEVLFQIRSEEKYAHIKILKYNDNKRKEKEHGAEYVLEHETFVGNEYLMPLSSGKLVKCVRRPGDRDKYVTIKQVIHDCPAFVRVENDTTSHELGDVKQPIVIPANTVLEVKRIYMGKTQDIFLDCSDGRKTYTFNENEKVNFSFMENGRKYGLEALFRTTLLPKVILFHDANPLDIVIRDNELRSALGTIIDGPIEVIGFVNVEYLTCWVRNAKLKSYETMLLHKSIWNKANINLRCFPDDSEKENHISQKYGPCLKSDFIYRSLFVLPLMPSEPVWLRNPKFFKQPMEGNTSYEVYEVPYIYSSEEENSIYSEIVELSPLIPKRDRNRTQTTLKQMKAPDVRKKNGNKGAEIKTPISPCMTRVESEQQFTSKWETTGKFDIYGNDSKRQHTSEIPLKSEQQSSSQDDQVYTQLDFPKAERAYDKLVLHRDTVQKSVLSGYSDNFVDKTEQVNIDIRRKVLKDNQTEKDFFNYSVKEVTFCFEHCGLKSLAYVCYKKKLDGSFFKGFEDWKILDLSDLDVIIIQKVIYDGWRSNDDCEYNVDTHL